MVLAALVCSRTRWGGECRPIALETTDKTWIKVDREADIFIYDRIETTCVVIFDPKRRKFVLTPEQISAIETR